MTSRQDPTEQLLDVLVYAPLGLLLEARDLLPKLADKGRQRMGGQVTVARMIGELAVRQGQRRADQVLKRMREQSRPAQPSSSASSTETADEAEPANGQRPPASAATTPSSAASAGTPGSAPPEAPSLAIPGYDTLSASQVVPRLEGLSPAELEAIRAYEHGTRARKTILTRIDQLRGDV